MNAIIEQLHDELERTRRSRQAVIQFERLTRGDPLVKALAALAHALETAPQLQADPHFVTRLEQRMLVHHKAQQRTPYRW